jgi:hypothetical protein
MLGIAPSPVRAAGPEVTEGTPGEVFAAAVRNADPGGDLAVSYALHLPAAFPLFASRPRYTVRHLMKTVEAVTEPVPYVYEPPVGRLDSGSTYASTPEAAFGPQLAETGLTEIAVQVPLPDGLLENPALLASFVDLRVLVRLSARENDVLLNGSPDGVVPGLLKLPGIRTRRGGPDLLTTITTTAAEVEETGGSCDGLVAHPVVWWELVRQGVLGQLNAAGITVSRTRMVGTDRLLFGDFSAAATLLLSGIGMIAVRRGAGPAGADVIEARTRIGLAVRLPQHLISLERGDG